MGGAVVDFIDAPVVARLQRGRRRHRDRGDPPGPGVDARPAARRPGVSPPRSETVPPALAGQRLDRVVALVGDVSRADAASLLADGRVTVDTAVQAKGSLRVAEGAVVTVDLPEPTAPGLAPEPDVDVPVRVRRRRRRGRRQAGRAWSCTPGPATTAAPSLPGCWPATPRSPRSASPTGPASCTASTATPPGCSWWPAPPRPTPRWSSSCSTRTVARRYTALVVGHPEARQGLVDAPIGRSPRQPTLMAVRADGQGGPHPLRGAGDLRPAVGHRAGHLPAGDRPHPPDPGPHEGHRPPGGGRRRATAAVAPGWPRPGCSSTPPTWASDTPAPARASPSTARCPTTWPACWPSSGRPRPLSRPSGATDEHGIGVRRAAASRDGDLIAPVVRPLRAVTVRWRARARPPRRG